MPLVLRLTPAAAAAAAATALLVACGGGGADSSPPPALVVPASSGLAVDGYLSGASALCDTNGNGNADAGETSVTTDATGKFSFTAGCTSGIVVRGGVSVDTGVLFTGVLKAPAGSSVVTPLTTLLVAGLTQSQIKTTLGLPSGTDLQSVDPALKTNGVLADPDLYKKTLVVQQLVQKTAELLAGLGGASSDSAKQALYTEVGQAFAGVLKTSAALGSGSNAGTTLNASVVAGLVKAAAVQAGAAASTSAEVKAGLAKVNADALGAVSAASLKAEAEAIAKATEADLTAVTKAQQNSDTITNFVAANSAQLAAAPTALTAALGSTLAGQVSGALAAPPASNYLALAADAISLINGVASSSYSMAQFQSTAGISIAWPMAEAMLLKLTLNEVGSYAIAADQKVTAAVSITETTATGKGEIRAYIDQVNIQRTAAGLKISVPTGANALVYGVSSDGKKKAIIDFGASVAGITNTLTTAAGLGNPIVLGNVVNYAVNKIGKDFTGIGSLRGTYKVSVVLNGVPLRKADGSLLPALAIAVPTELDSSGAAVKATAVSGWGLSGSITLAD